MEWTDGHLFHVWDIQSILAERKRPTNLRMLSYTLKLAQESNRLKTPASKKAVASGLL